MSLPLLHGVFCGPIRKSFGDQLSVKFNILPSMRKCDSHKKLTSGDYQHYSCLCCGDFKVSGSAISKISNIRPSEYPDVIASLGHWLREQQRLGRGPMLTTDIIQRHEERPHFPRVTTQTANLLKVMGDTAGEPGPKFSFEPERIQFRVGCKTKQGLVGLGKHLQDQGFIDGQVGATGQITAALTVAGWIEYERVLEDNSVGRKAFIAMPFGKPDLEEDWLPKLRHAVKQTGYELERVDDKPEAGLIDTRMKLQIKEARFLLVELTHSNLGAYWEAGMAEGLGKPVIYLHRKDSEGKPHFDVEHAFRVQWNAEEMDTALDTLKATIRNSMPDAVMTD